MNVEVYQDDINATYGTKFKIPVVYYSTLMAVAYGRSATDAAINGQIIPAKQLGALAGKSPSVPASHATQEARESGLLAFWQPFPMLYGNPVHRGKPRWKR
jgi:hypothetical protein